ncbi:MAG: nuclear transport factor 2 family protein [Bacteroidota bacterium]|nr:nuclear transport factor 2 family protein [Candidatus Kapabacteria bacterium]MDW8219206.1 nuclear transport factor 2 family protein [Bacteroidota bacterium]
MHKQYSPQESIDAFYNAIIQKNVERIVASYVQSPATYVFVEGPRYATQGIDRIAQGWKDFCAAPLSLQSITWVEQPQCEEHGNIAWIAGLIKLRVEVQGRSVEQTFRATFVLHKSDEGFWKIRQEHVSAPLPDPYGIGDWLKPA